MAGALRAVAEPDIRDGAVEEAWAIVSDAMLEASQVEGLPGEDYARLLRCYRHACRKARRAPLVGVSSGERT